MSERLRKFGRKVLVGDLAIKKESEHLIEAPVEDVEEVEEAEEKADESNLT